MAALPTRVRARILATPPSGLSVAPSRGPAPLALVVYGGLALLTIGVALVRGQSPLATDGWLEIDAWLRIGLGLLGGVLLAAATVLATRIFVKRWTWAKALHDDLRSSVRGASDTTIAILALSSGITEELFFRGLLTPAVGLWLSALAFGALHQLRGRAGFLWAIWAGVMGLLFGALFLATGSLFGPIVAHVTINLVNLRFLRDHDPAPRKPRHLGGLLGRV